MAILQTHPINLVGISRPPPGFEYEHNTFDEGPVSTEEFETGLDNRDDSRCIICGAPETVQHTHIIPASQEHVVSTIHSASPSFFYL